ncbi:MAG: hypothetical protein ACT4OS_01655 [Acidimicrobiales bacterium]
MTDWPLPPFFDPHGPEGDDASVVEAWLSGVRAPHSARLHVEGRVLRVERDLPAALNLGEATVLVRTNLPEPEADVGPVITEVLIRRGLRLLEPESQLALAVGIQMVSAWASTWDLWGTDSDQATAALHQAVMGGANDVLVSGSPVFGAEPE